MGGDRRMKGMFILQMYKTMISRMIKEGLILVLKKTKTTTWKRKKNNKNNVKISGFILKSKLKTGEETKKWV